MSVIFQLFCAEDLNRLKDTEELEELKTVIIDALEGTTSSKASYTRNRRRVAQPLSLKISLNTEPSEDPPSKVREALNNRFHEVSHQLTAPQLNPPQPSFDFDNLLRQRNNTASDKEALILKWAISCEVNNFEFYKRLLDARKAAYEWFFKEKGQRPKGPDSPYSPFNPLHPLYNLFYGLSKPEL